MEGKQCPQKASKTTTVQIGDMFSKKQSNGAIRDRTKPVPTFTPKEHCLFVLATTPTPQRRALVELWVERATARECNRRPCRIRLGCVLRSPPMKLSTTTTRLTNTLSTYLSHREPWRLLGWGRALSSPPAACLASSPFQLQSWNSRRAISTFRFDQRGHHKACQTKQTTPGGSSTTTSSNS